MKSNYLKSSLQFFILCLFLLVTSCQKDHLCLEFNDPYIEINGDREVFDPNKNGIVYTSNYREDLGGFAVSIDEFIHIVGGEEINDFIAVFIKAEEIKEGIYPIIRDDEYFCKYVDFGYLETDQAYATVQIGNCCSFKAKEGNIVVTKCNDSFLIHGINLTFTELECDVEKGGSLQVGFELIYN